MVGVGVCVGVVGVLVGVCVGVGLGGKQLSPSVITNPKATKLTSYPAVNGNKQAHSNTTFWPSDKGTSK